MNIPLPIRFTLDSYQPYDCDDLTAERGSGNLEPSATTLDNKTAGNDNLKDDNAARQSAMGTLYKLEDSKVGQTISNTEWGYPIVLSLHAIGMATMVGIALMLTLRVLGFASVIPVTAMANYWRVAKHKKLAAIAMVSWVAAIIAGRLIGYMS